MKNILYIICLFIVSSCQEKQSEQIVEVIKNPFLWESANVYFLLTDRFHNGDTSNDINFNRKDDAAKLRGFKGGDIKGVTQKN
jgi:alpha-amylase